MTPAVPPPALVAPAPPLRPDRQDRFFTASDGTRLHYIEAGDPAKPTIVFVPGWTMPAWIFDRQIDAFAIGYHIIAFDPRGQGSSAQATSGYTLPRRTQDLAEMVEAADSRPVVIVGWSLGVLEVLSYIRTDGDARVAGVVLIDNSIGENPAPPPAPPSDRPPATRKCTRAFVAGMFSVAPPSGYIDRLTASCTRLPASFSNALLQFSVPRSYWRDGLYATAKPILYVVRPRWVRQAQSLVGSRPNSDYVLFDKAGHALFVDEAARFNTVLAGFLRKVWGTN